MSDKALSLLVYGPSKTGKSTLSLTTPAPRLLLDVESASRFLKTKKIKWNPLTEAPPKYDGTWETCVVSVNDFATALKAYDYLKSGNHPFKSVILDSISELQVKAQESVAGRAKLRTQDWGELLNKISFFGRDLRDLTTHATNPVQAVLVTAIDRVIQGNREKGEPDVHKPYLQGQAGSQVPYWYDITGYYYVTQNKNEEGKIVKSRNLLISNNPMYEAGNRVPDLEGIEVIPNPNISEMLDAIFGEDND